MIIKRTAVLALILLLPAAARALDKKALELHLRKTLNLDTRTVITAEDPAPSGVSDLLVVNVTIQGNKYPVFMTKDEKKYLWGQLVDFTVDPDEERKKQISLTNVHAKGSASAPVTIVEYSDMQCSHCRDAHKILDRDLHKAYTKDQVRWVHKHFPLTGHQWAEPAAVAAECAAKQKGAAYWTMSGLLFDAAPTLSTATIRAQSIQFAEKAGLNVAAFKTCLDDPKMLEKIKADKMEGLKVGIQSTPTLVVNGRLKRGLQNIDDLKPMIDEKLKEPKK